MTKKTLTKSLFLTTALFCTGLVAVDSNPSEAAAKARKPTVTRIQSSKAKNGKVRVVVTVRLPKSQKKSSVSSVQVRLGNRTCRIARTKTKCAFAGVKANSKIKVSARTLLRSGKQSKWSSPVRFRASSRKKWMRKTVEVNRALLVSTQKQSYEFTKIQSLSGTPVARVSRMSVRSSSFSSPEDVVFRVDSVVALAQTVDNNEINSGLLAVSRTGEVQDALLSGSASIRDFFVAPGNKFYVLFSSPTALVAGGEKCLLAEVDQQTGAPSCIDSSLIKVLWTTNSPIQFDSEGRIYFAGSVDFDTQVLRRYDSGVSTDLISEEIEIRDFFVDHDGSVLVTGTTVSTQAHWLRRVDPSGLVTTLVPDAQASFITRFSDGKVYVGTWGENDPGVREYISSTGALDENWWISGNSLNQASRSLRNDADALCANENRKRLDAFCSHYGAYVTSIFSLQGQATYAVAGNHDWKSRVLMEYYPSVRSVPTIASYVSFAGAVGSKMVIVGASSSGTNVLTIYDPSTVTETIVIDAVNEIEVRSLAYAADQNTLFFSGLRLSDNEIVFGEVEL